MTWAELLAGLGVILGGLALAVIAWRTRTVLACLLGVAAIVLIPVLALLGPTHRARATALILGAIGVTVGAVLHIIGQRFERLLADDPREDDEGTCGPEEHPRWTSP